MTEGYWYVRAGWFVAGDVVVERPCIEVDMEQLEAVSVGRQCPWSAVDLGRHTAVIPGLCNAHSHLLDLVLPECGEGMPLESLVAQPAGLKYRLLGERAAHLPEALSSLRLDSSVVATYAELGLVEAAARIHVQRLHIYPQPISKDTSSIIKTVEKYKAIGLDTVFDVEEFLDEFIQAVKDANASVQVHVSETARMHRRGDYEIALAIPNTVLVHCTYMPPDLLAELASERPVVICPSSNALLVGRIPDVVTVARRLMSGDRPAIGIGTDNAAWNEPLVAEELRSSYLLLRGDRVAVSKLLLYAATIGGHIVLGERYADAIAASHPVYMYTCDITASLVKRLASSTLKPLGFRLSLKEYS